MLFQREVPLASCTGQARQRSVVALCSNALTCGIHYAAFCNTERPRARSDYTTLRERGQLSESDWHFHTGDTYAYGLNTICHRYCPALSFTSVRIRTLAGGVEISYEALLLANSERLVARVVVRKWRFDVRRLSTRCVNGTCETSSKANCRNRFSFQASF